MREKENREKERRKKKKESDNVSTRIACVKWKSRISEREDEG